MDNEDDVVEGLHLLSYDELLNEAPKDNTAASIIIPIIHKLKIEEKVKNLMVEEVTDLIRPILYPRSKYRNSRKRIPGISSDLLMMMFIYAHEHGIEEGPIFPNMI